MQPPQPDQQMQQQIQFTTPQYQQLQQPIMLCPVQYVYEPMLSEDHTQSTEPYQNQAYVINVQNPPPWAQNRPNMVIMQQMPPNIQPYIPQQMVQNPIYPYQPMIVQERQIPYNQSMINPQILQNAINQQMLSVTNQMMQTNQQIINPQMNVQHQMNQNTIMNPIMQNPVRYQMEKRETPILASMLSVRKPPQNELVSLIRPQYNVRPQMIIVNPITKHTCGHAKESPIPIEKQKTDIQSIRSQVPEGLSVKTIKVPATAMVKPNENVFQNVMPDNVNRTNAKPKQVYNKEPTNYKRKIKELLELNNNGSGVPAKINCQAKPDEQVCQVQVPIDTNIVEPQMNNIVLPNMYTQPIKAPLEEKKLRNTVYVQARGRINDLRPNEFQTKTHTNIYNIATSIENTMNKSIESSNKNVVTTNLEPNSANNEHLQFVTVNNANILYSNINPYNLNMEIKPGSEININTARLEDTSMQTDNLEADITLDNQITEDTVQNMNDTQTEQNTPLKEEIKVNDVKENNVLQKVIIPQKISVKDAEVSTDCEIDRHNTPNPINSEASTQNDLITINKLIVNESKTLKSSTKVNANIQKAITTNTQETQRTLEPNDLQTKSTMTLISKLPKSLDDETVNKSTMTEMSNMTKIIIPTESNKTKSEATPNINNDVMVKSKPKLAKDDDRKKTEKLVKVEMHKEIKKTVDAKASVKEAIVPYVLTHVLDGHIIQESNVPFEVQKTPILAVKEKPILIETTKVESVREEREEDKTEGDITERGTEVSSNTETENARIAMNKPDTSKRRDKKTEEIDEDNPFKNLNKDVVEAWTVNEVTSHLMRFTRWRDTAMKLSEQEIDGESLLLVRKDQLLRIDICEDQAQAIKDFIDK